MKYNCPYCGAVIEPDLHKCPYCGIQYLDISYINFNEKTPIVLKLKIGDGDDPTYITQCVLPRVDLDASRDYKEIANSDSYLLAKLITGTHIHTNLSFESTHMYDGSTAIIENKEMKTVWK